MEKNGEKDTIDNCGKKWNKVKKKAEEAQREESDGRNLGKKTERMGLKEGIESGKEGK